jgi:hypothetical protein
LEDAGQNLGTEMIRRAIRVKVMGNDMRLGDIGLDEKFVRDGHRADDYDCEACPPDYPRGCTCGGLVHAQKMHSNEIKNENPEIAYCCDECGASFEEDIVANEIDDDLMFE